MDCLEFGSGVCAGNTFSALVKAGIYKIIYIGIYYKWWSFVISSQA